MRKESLYHLSGWASVLLLGAALGLFVPAFLLRVQGWGQHIPYSDLQLDYVLAVFWAAVLAGSILLWPVPVEHKRVLLLLWLVKCGVALLFMLLYESHYPILDAYQYFSRAHRGPVPWDQLGIERGEENITALTYLHLRLVPGSYHAAKLSFAMIGLVGIYVYYRAGIMLLGREAPWLFWLLGLFPSVLFWSSILGKDPLTMLAVALYSYGVIGWYRRQRLRYLGVVALGIALGVLIRLWLGPILMLPLVVFVLWGTRGFGRRALVTLLAVAALVVTAQQFRVRFQLETVQDLISTIDYWSRGWAQGGSAQAIGTRFTSVGSIVAFIPLGAFTALFRPLPGEVLNPFGLLAGAENLFLLALAGLALARIRWSTLRDPLVLWALSLIVVWASVYGLVAYQNLGTAVRFRLQILPVLLGTLLFLAWGRAAEGILRTSNITEGIRGRSGSAGR